MIYLLLALVFLQVGLLSFGGGYSAITIIQNLVVDKYGWFSYKTFAELIRIAEMTPGPIMLNTATFVGMQTGGILGALIATFCCILPSIVLATILIKVLKKISEHYMVKSVLRQLKPVIIGLILSTCVSICLLAIWNGRESISLANTNWISIIVIVGSLILLNIKKLNIKPVMIILLSGFIGFLDFLI